MDLFYYLFQHRVICTNKYIYFFLFRGIAYYICMCVGCSVDDPDPTILKTPSVSRYMARTRWAKAIKAVRFTVKMQLALPDKSRPDFHSQEIPVLI